MRRICGRQIVVVSVLLSAPPALPGRVVRWRAPLQCDHGFIAISPPPARAARWPRRSRPARGQSSDDIGRFAAAGEPAVAHTIAAALSSDLADRPELLLLRVQPLIDNQLIPQCQRGRLVMKIISSPHPGLSNARQSAMVAFRFSDLGSGDPFVERGSSFRIIR